MINRSSKNAFTLIELLIILAIAGTLAAIVIPVFEHAQAGARRSVDQSNLRQIGQSALVYADDHQGSLPPTNLVEHTGLPEGSDGETTVTGFAAAFAIGGGLNDGSVWISANDRAGNAPTSTGGPIMTDTTPRTLIRDHGSLGSLSAISYAVVAGLRADDRPTAPIALFRGLHRIGRWHPTQSLYEDGGYIVFLGGNVRFYEDAETTSSPGKFVRWSYAPSEDGEPTHNIFETIPYDGVRVFRTLPVNYAPGSRSTDG